MRTKKNHSENIGVILDLEMVFGTYTYITSLIPKMVKNIEFL